MSKEYLEAYFKIDNTLCLNSQNLKFGIDEDEHIDCQNIDEVVNCLETIKEALQRLEAIDNANPSEVLECLEKARKVLTKMFGKEVLDKEGINFDTIKQALLKAQEPKQYLKWEDLEFKKQQQVMDVLLNGKPYVLHFYKLSTQTEVNMFAIDMHIVTLNSYYPEDVQFFNDLHLERVEE